MAKPPIRPQPDPGAAQMPAGDNLDAAAVASLGALPGATAGGNAPAAGGAVPAALPDGLQASSPALKSQIRLTARLMAGALAGKVLGFLREIEMARLLGASFVADSFRGALTAVLLPIAPMQGEMVPSVLIPLHRQWRSEGVEVACFTSLMVVMTSISLTMTLLVWLIAPVWVDIVVGGFGPDAHEVTVRFVRIMVLSMPASTLSNCMSCIEISVGRSRITTIRASVTNVGVMLGILIMAWTGYAQAIAWGYVAAFNVTVLYGGAKLVREREINIRTVRWRHIKTAVRATFLRMKPLFVQPLADQGNILLERLLGSTFVTGSLASLDYARTVTETALYLVSQPIGYVMLAQPPGQGNTVRDRVAAVSRPLLGLAIPAALYLFMFAPDIVELVFRRGRFQDEAVLLTSHALQGISLGLWASTLGWILIRILTAEGRNPTVARIMILSYASNVGINTLFWLVGSIGVLGLGLGEATRGCVMLIGSGIALGCGMPLLRQVLRLLPFVLVLAIGSVFIREHVDSIVLRLLAGGALYGLGCGVALLPDLRQVARHVLARRQAKRTAFASHKA